MLSSLQSLQPMLATPGPLPQDVEAWSFEYKWDGIRAIAEATGQGGLRLTTRNGNEVTAWFPELHPLGAALGRGAVLDGEIVALGPNGRPDFGRLQGRLGLSSVDRRRIQPVQFYVFDLLRLDGRPLLDRTLQERRRLLEELGVEGANWSTPPAHPGAGPAMLQVSRSMGLEGVVAKRLDSRYLPGERSPAWVKVHNRLRQEFVVGGWSEGEGMRRGSVGALLLGCFGSGEDPGRLVYVGRCGSGFRGKSLARLHRLLESLPRPGSPFDSSGDEEDGAVHWVEPQLVAEVEFAGLTHNRRLRQASFKGLRVDKPARDVVWEVMPWPAPSGAAPSASAS